MADEKKRNDDDLVTREDCRKKGLKVTNTKYQRWEKAKRVTPVKPGGARSSRVFYRWDEVRINLLNQPL
jgi:hypothetical protein